MIVKPCEKTLETRLYDSLSRRIVLAPKYAARHYKLIKGFEGELRFCNLLEENLTGEFLILNNLLYEVHGSKLQVDNSLIYQGKLHSFEVKNFEGNHYIDNDRWYTRNGSEIKDPLLQLKRSGTLFRQKLKETDYQSSLDTDIVFVNPEFYLYQAPLHLPIIFPPQINHLLKTLNKKIGTAKLTPHEHQLSDKLLSMQIEENPYDDLPSYSLDSSRKGMTCKKCHSFDTKVEANKLVCIKCDYHEPVTSAVLRSIEEFTLLYPGREITTKDITEWCGVVSKRTIRNILKRYYNMIYLGKSSYFIKKSD